MRQESYPTYANLSLQEQCGKGNVKHIIEQGEQREHQDRKDRILPPFPYACQIEEYHAEDDAGQNEADPLHHDDVEDHQDEGQPCADQALLLGRGLLGRYGVLLLCLRLRGLAQQGVQQQSQRAEDHQAAGHVGECPCGHSAAYAGRDHAHLLRDQQQ